MKIIYSEILDRQREIIDDVLTDELRRLWNLGVDGCGWIK